MVILVQKAPTDFIGFRSLEEILDKIAMQAVHYAPIWRGRYELRVHYAQDILQSYKQAWMTLIWDPAPGYTFNADCCIEPALEFAKPVHSNGTWSISEADIVHEALRWQTYIAAMIADCMAQEQAFSERYKEMD